LGDASDKPAGAASRRKIGGNLQGEPILPSVDATSDREWQRARMPEGCEQKLSGDKQLITLKRSDLEREQIWVSPRAVTIS
jgi:hypothetical protein